MFLTCYYVIERGQYDLLLIVFDRLRGFNVLHHEMMKNDCWNYCSIYCLCLCGIRSRGCFAELGYVTVGLWFSFFVSDLARNIGP